MSPTIGFARRRCAPSIFAATSRRVNALNGVIVLGTANLATDASTAWSDGANVDAHTYEGYTYDFFFKRFGRHGLDNQDSRSSGSHTR